MPAGGSAVRRSTFPTWPPNTESALYASFLASYQDLFGTPMTSEVIHAGLECGYIAEMYPEMEIVFQRGTSLEQNAKMSVMMRIDGRGG